MQAERKQVILGDLKEGFVPEENTDYLILSDNRTISIRAYGYKYHCEGYAENFGNVLIKTERITLEKFAKTNTVLVLMTIPSESITCVSTLKQDSPFVCHGLRIYKRK